MGLIPEGKSVSLPDETMVPPKAGMNFRVEKVEAGESKEAALKREWQEELDIEIENIQYPGFFEGSTKIIHFI